MWVIVGLGNPGADYAHTRHNVGFMVVEALARRWNLSWRDEPGLRQAEGRIAGYDARLVQPQVFMNRSGDVLDRCLAAADSLLVVYDDLDLPAGEIRVRRHGGTGGHRGMTSIVARVGTEFARVRIGIGRPPVGNDPANHVLAPLPPAELANVQAAVERGGDAVECLIADGTEVAMNRFNVRGLPAREKDIEET